MTSASDSNLETGMTTFCRAWIVRRRDGTALGFTDHDSDLVLDGVTCRADAGLTARALQQTTGLSVDNTEALGALSHDAISEADLSAGRYDGAEVRVWLVNWAEPEDRSEVFRGTLGEITRKGSEFKAELRGLSQPLNEPVGLAYTRQCSAVLGDSRCRFDLSKPGYVCEAEIVTVGADGRILEFNGVGGFDDRWFEGGRVDVLSGSAAGLWTMIRSDRTTPFGRRVELWQSVQAAIVPGDVVRFTAGCDKRAVTCRSKFANYLNFRGFPYLPGEDWLTAYPRSGQPSSGGSLINPTGT